MTPPNTFSTLNRAPKDKKPPGGMPSGRSDRLQGDPGEQACRLELDTQACVQILVYSWNPARPSAESQSALASPSGNQIYEPAVTWGAAATIGMWEIKQWLRQTVWS
jgi:hypothetical protein